VALKFVLPFCSPSLPGCLPAGRFPRRWLAALPIAAALLVSCLHPAAAQIVPYSPSAPVIAAGRNTATGVISGQTAASASAETETSAARRTREENDRSDRSDRNDRSARNDRSDRKERNDYNDHNDRNDRASNEVQEVPTEFERLVAASTGTNLPIFGNSLFNNAPSTFAPADNIPVNRDYIIGPGDELQVQVFGAVNQQGNFTVDRIGNIAYPEVGTIHVAGVHYDQLQAFLKDKLNRVYRNFDLNVNLGELRSIQVFVVGAARRPGSYTISSLSTLLNAIFVSGGPLPQGSLRDIQVLRNNVPIVHFDLYDLLLHGDKSKDISLSPGDVIFIPPVGPQAAITGSVNNPAIYELRPGTTVNQLIALSGGDTSVALGTHVRLERIFEHSMRNIVDVDLAERNLTLADGDIVTVSTILDRFKNAITLRGNVAFPGRYVWREGMHITDLIPARDQLITRDYYRRRTMLANIISDYMPATVGSLQLRGSGDTQRADTAIQAGSASSSSNGGNSVGAALTSVNSVFPATTDVVLSGPDLDWNYAVIERLEPQTLSTSLIAFNPGKLYMQGDQSQNLELQPGDVITFFSTADLKVPTSQQTRFVRLEGEFIASGVYSVQPGEGLRHLVARAGGFTGDSYLFGSEFTRQSTRRVQQQRLNEYADNLEAQVSVNSAAGNARAINDRDAAATAAAALDARQAVARLRRLVPLGRIVLELKPDSRALESIPDLPLEDGDRFVVPRVPSTVSVEGRVYSANAFVFERGRKEHDYLRQAGGPDRQADPKRTFILRADGSVFSRQYGNVDHATIFPGDTIIVPPQFDRRAVLRNLLDISSIVGQFGLGAAAINVLK
jgi:polysaccharide export outer membrane protein